tara:strand:+ start:366 stop:971 length:606 start_codon:yes stop_codon:yes gene_type:complete
MNKKVYTCLGGILISLLMASCAVGPSKALKPVPAGFLYEGGYINVRAPNSEGWHLVNYSPAGMEFARRGAVLGETFAAQVLMFPIPSTNDSNDFLSFIKSGFKQNSNSTRYEEIESNIKLSEGRGYTCVSVKFTTKDQNAQTSPTRRESLLLQAESLYCVHPVEQETGFSIMYSHRGKSLYPNLSVEAQAFISGVQVPEID